MTNHDAAAVVRPLTLAWVSRHLEVGERIVRTQEEIVTPAALRPRVGRLEHAFKDAEEAARFVAACNVVLATPQILSRSVGNVRTALLSSFSHLIVDEASLPRGDVGAGDRWPLRPSGASHRR
ncbi:DEAD/DEAH box helicase family protein [Streptomyces dysideae]|uniref:Uncharacterized protein n=1 Tax=Streptomyces dysideae TaxID=909626 RepID=A0A117RY77_9ACTN|nr:hypothetical protein [Streptomyces dysideae]KUO15469.1 hypothetical protein AQJ91_40965 [Streptomyces dysideae]